MAAKRQETSWFSVFHLYLIVGAFRAVKRDAAFYFLLIS